MTNTIKVLIVLPVAWFAGGGAFGQDVLGTGFGLPNSSPPIMWPRGMSIEALSPSNLYPNGPQFGLSNTAGGFGTSGTGPVSGVGLAERTVSPLVREQMDQPFRYLRRLTDLFSAEAAQTRGQLSSVLSSRFRGEVGKTSTVEAQPGTTVTSAVPGFSAAVDAILNDKPATIESILKTP